MKIVLIILTVLLVGIVALSQVYASKEKKNIEMHPYIVLRSFDDFEIRKYESANFSYVKMNVNTYKQSSGTGFRTLAGYIFGGNEEGQKIAMTSPVTMQMDDSTTTMMFLIPSAYEMDELPSPNDANVKFKTEPAKLVAAIRFGGWASDSRIEDHKQKLAGALEEEGIPHTGKFSYLGYNPPFELINRRNEVVVELANYNF